jgi:hypothetical protein
MYNKLSKKDILFFLKLANRNPNLSDYDLAFIENIEARVDAGKPLTERQEDFLHSIAMRG